MFKIVLFGYSRKQVDRYIRDTQGYIDTLKKDVEYLKREQSEMRSQIERLIMSEKIYGNLDAAQNIVREYQ